MTGKPSATIAQSSGTAAPYWDSGAAACRTLPGGSPTGAAPHAGQLARIRRPVAQAVTASLMTAPA